MASSTTTLRPPLSSAASASAGALGDKWTVRQDSTPTIVSSRHQRTSPSPSLGMMFDGSITQVGRSPSHLVVCFLPASQSTQFQSTRCSSFLRLFTLSFSHTSHSHQAKEQTRLLVMPSTNAKAQQAQKQALIQALNEHRINTIAELRRVERVFATLGSSDITQPMTAACKSLSCKCGSWNTTYRFQGFTSSTPTVF